jgi:exopolysaccharide biosynthesis operon protein EpsL
MSHGMQAVPVRAGKLSAVFAWAVMLSVPGGKGAQPRNPRPELPEGVTLVPYLYGGVLYDSNLFRVADDEEAQARLGTTDTDDVISRAGTGVKARVPVSLQVLRFDGWLEHVDFDRFDQLDHNAADADAAWDWQAGRLWSGSLEGGYSRGLARFEELESVARDIKTSRDLAFDAGFRFLPDWELAAGSEVRRTDHRRRDRLDRTQTTHFAALRYYSLAGTHVGLRGSRTEAEFDDPEVFDSGETLVNDYTETAYGLVLGWEGTSKSRLQARLGYTRRAHEQRPQRDFDGLTARAGYLWRASAKTSLQLDVWRELQSLEDEVTQFVEVRGLRLSPHWQAMPWLRIRGALAAERRQFDGASGTDSPNEGRGDDVRSASLGLDYELLRRLHFSVEAEVEERDSNVDDRDYRYEQIFAGAAYAF